MFKNNFWTPPKSPCEMFKPNARMITKTTDDTTERNHLDSWFSFSKPIFEAFKIINILKII